MNKPFLLIYQDDSHDLYTKEFNTENQLMQWVDNNIPNNKFVVVFGNISSVDTSSAC